MEASIKQRLGSCLDDYDKAFLSLLHTISTSSSRLPSAASSISSSSSSVHNGPASSVSASAVSSSVDAQQRDITSSMDQILSIEKRLRSQVCQLHEHQKREAHLVACRAAATQRESILVSFATELQRAESILRCAIDESRPKIQLLKQAQNARMKPSTIVSYARRIGSTTSAPPGWPAVPLFNYHCPAPIPEEIVVSQLHNPLSSYERMQNQFSQIVSNIKSGTIPQFPQEQMEETGGVGAAQKKRRAEEEEEKEEEEWEDAAVRQAEVPAAAAAAAAAPALPFALPFALPAGFTLPPIPPGWKPGDALPIPAMPVGWKPGDPIGLPVFPPRLPVPAPSAPPPSAIQPAVEAEKPAAPPGKPAKLVQLVFNSFGDSDSEEEEDDEVE